MAFPESPACQDWAARGLSPDMVSRVAAEPSEPTQETQPKGKDDEGKPAKPVTIPVPTRGEFFRDLDKLAKAEKPRSRDGN